MPFSLGSYLLGVGTIVGALAFAVGSGVLTKTAVQETTAAARIRPERVARADPRRVAAPQVTEEKKNPAPPVEPAAAVPPEPVPPGQADSPQPEVRSETAAT